MTGILNSGILGGGQAGPYFWLPCTVLFPHVHSLISNDQSNIIWNLENVIIIIDYHHISYI